MLRLLPALAVRSTSCVFFNATLRPALVDDEDAELNLAARTMPLALSPMEAVSFSHTPTHRDKEALLGALEAGGARLRVRGCSTPAFRRGNALHGLMYAIHDEGGPPAKGGDAVVARLARLGADPSAPDPLGQTPLSLSLEFVGGSHTALTRAVRTRAAGARVWGVRTASGHSILAQARVECGCV